MTEEKKPIEFWKQSKATPDWIFAALLVTHPKMTELSEADYTKAAAEVCNIKIGA